MPITRSVGKPEASQRDVAHRVERVRDDDEDRVRARRRAACSTTARTMPAFFASRSSRLMPGWRARPEVTTMTSEPAVSA